MSWICIMMMMMMMNCFCGMVDQRKACSLISSWNHPLSEILIMANLRYSVSRIWTWEEPEFRLRWMKLCSSDNHSSTALHHARQSKVLWKDSLLQISLSAKHETSLWRGNISLLQVRSVEVFHGIAFLKNVAICRALISLLMKPVIWWNLKS